RSRDGAALSVQVAQWPAVSARAGPPALSATIAATNVKRPQPFIPPLPSALPAVCADSPRIRNRANRVMRDGTRVGLISRLTRALGHGRLRPRAQDEERLDRPINTPHPERAREGERVEGSRHPLHPSPVAPPLVAPHARRRQVGPDVRGDAAGETL